MMGFCAVLKQGVQRARSAGACRLRACARQHRVRFTPPISPAKLAAALVCCALLLFGTSPSLQALTCAFAASSGSYSGTFGSSSLLVTSAANDWQIVSGGYEGNSSDYKTETDDNDAMTAACMQKNVVPTDTENEFLVYVSIDKKLSVEELFTVADFAVTTSNGYTAGDITTTKRGNFSTLSADEDDGTSLFSFTFELYSGTSSSAPGVLITEFTVTKYASTSVSNNGTVILIMGTLDGSTYYYVVGNGVSLKDANSDGVTLQLYAGNIDFGGIYGETNGIVGVALNNFTDTMGENIKIKSIESADGSVTWNESSLTWTPEANDSAEVEYDIGTDYYYGAYHNIAQLVYRISLDLDPGDSSGLSYDAADETFETNSSASLDYAYQYYTVTTAADYDEDNVTGTYEGTIEPETPVVRGMLYDLQLLKTDEDGEALSGATFTLYKWVTETDEDGNETTELEVVTDDDGNTVTATSDADGLVTFTNLSWGTYSVTETEEPFGYTAADGSSDSATYELCYTTNADNLVVSTITSYATAQCNTTISTATTSSGAQYAASVVNESASYTLVVTKVSSEPDEDGNADAIEGAGFTLYVGSEGAEGDAADVYSDAELSVSAAGRQLKTDESGTVSFYGLEVNTTYSLVETYVPTGYSAPSGYTTIVINADGTVTVNGVEAEVSDEDYVISITLENKPLPDVPFTGGGTGVLACGLCGMALVTGAGALGWRRRRTSS